MSTRFKIDYNGWSDDSSPFSKDVKIKNSHSKLIANTQNSKKAKEWRKNNPNKSSEIAHKGGQVSNTKEQRERCSKTGKKYGAENAIKYIPLETKQRNGKKFGKLNLLKEFICEKCGLTVNKGNYVQFHSKKCREADKIKLIDLLPNKFTKSIVKHIAEENGIYDWKKLNILNENCLYTKCIIKVEKPNQYNPSWYSKNKKQINKVKKYL